MRIAQLFRIAVEYVAIQYYVGDDIKLNLGTYSLRLRMYKQVEQYDADETLYE